MKYQEYNTNGHGRGRGPTEIDSDLSEIRLEMSETLHLLEDKFSPRALIEQLFSGARSGVRGAGHGSSEFVGNLGATIRDNPVPMLLLASGVVSLLARERTGAQRAARRGPIPGEDTMAHDIAKMANAVDDAHSMKSRAHAAAGTVEERARDMRERAGEFGEHAGERARELRAHAHETGAAARERVRDAMHHTRERGSRTLQEEPLVIVGLGLAIGAMLGVGMPVSERERRILGHEGEGILRRGEGAIGRAKQAVQAGVERATDVATQPIATQPTQPIATQPITTQPIATQPVATQQRPQAASLQGASVDEAPILIVESSSASVHEEVSREVREADIERSTETEQKS